MFYIYFSCFVLCFCVLKNGFSSFRIFCLPVVMYLKKCCFSSTKIWEDIFCFFSFCHVSFFFCSLVCIFFFEKRVQNKSFIFEMFFEIPCSSFFSLHFSHEKISTKKFIFVFSLLFFSSLLSQNSSCFSSSSLDLLLLFSFSLKSSFSTFLFCHLCSELLCKNLSLLLFSLVPFFVFCVFLSFLSRLFSFFVVYRLFCEHRLVRIVFF